APFYTINGNTLDLRTNSAAIAPQIVQNSASGSTLNNNLILTHSLSISDAGGGLGLHGPISGPGGLTVNSGAVFLTASNTFTGPVNINNGVMFYGGSGAIPAGADVTVGPAAALVPFFANSNTAATAIGTITLNGGKFTAPVFADYFIHSLRMN